MINIQPIKLLAGSHEDTGSTGQGCFMNVIAYLNGEPQITDRSTCVCVTIRPIAIWLNDFMRDDERQQLTPYVMRAMGTATDNKQVIIDRLREVVSFSKDTSTYDVEYAVEYVVESVVEYAAKHAERRKQIIAREIQFLDAVCPPLSLCVPQEVVIRAEQLVELNTTN